MKIREQIKNVIRTWTYENVVKKKLSKSVSKSKKLLGEIKKLEKEHDKLTKKKDSLNFEIQSTKEGNEKQIYIQATKLKYYNPFEIIIKLFFKPKAYVMYLDNMNNLSIHKLKKSYFLYELNNELYNLHEKMGTYRGKPFFLVKNNTAISLNVDPDKQLYYDPISYYNYVNKATKINLLNVVPQGLMDSLKGNLKWLLIIGIAIIFLMTPEGQNVINNLIGGNLG